MFESGSLLVGVNGLPLLKVDAESRSLGFELSGIRETGLKLSKLKTSGSHRLGVQGLIKISRETAKELSDMGWRLSIYDKGSSVLTMGSGVSRLTGRIRANPIKIRKVLSVL